MTDPKPSQTTLEYNGFLLTYKGTLKSNAYTSDCKFLLTVPIKNNYDQTWKCTSLTGAFQASTTFHSQRCRDKVNSQLNEETVVKTEHSPSGDEFIEWKSEQGFLRIIIRENPTLGPKAIQAEAIKAKQQFSSRIIKDVKKEIMEKLFPKDKKIAFYPTNCLCIEAEDNYKDNLYRFSAHSQFLHMESA